MREIGISPRFSRDKFVPLQTKQRYSTRDISGEVSLTLFFRGFVPFLSLADFVSRNKNLQVADLQRLKSCFGELVTATTSNHQNGPFRKNNEKLRLCKRCGRTFSIFRNSIFDKSKADFRIWMYIGYCMFYYHHVYFNVDKISRTQIIRETHAPSNATIYHIYDVLYKLFKSQNKVDMLLIFNILLPFMKIFHNMNPYRKKEH